MMEVQELSQQVSDSDGLLSWEEFYGSSNEDLVGSILEMYDLLIGRSSEIKEDLVKSQRQTVLHKSGGSLEGIKNKDVSGDKRKANAGNWCDVIKQNWNCRCVEKSPIEPITRCAACEITSGPEIRSTDLHDPPNSQSEPSLSKCQLVTCPAGLSTPSTPVQQRFRRLVAQLPLSLKRSESYFRWVARPSSVSSLASSSSSSSGSSGCYTRHLSTPSKSSAHLASIESLEDDSDIEAEDPKDKTGRFSKETEGSEDSGVHSLCASLPQDRPKYFDPHLSYMDKVVTEIIETEEVYVKDLQSIIEGYLMQWRSLNDFPLRDRLDILFGNIETVFSFNSLFLLELKQCGLDPVKVAKCFVKHNAGFSVYTEYCTNYPKTVSLLTELMRQEGTVRLFRERQAALQHTLPLGSYLLKPVQRILKYHLLLENIVKQYANGIEGYRDIVEALRTMTEIAQHINDMKRRHEHEVRVQEIQSLLLGWEGEDLTTFGELCAEGAFRIYGAKALRHVFLFDKMLLITKKKEGGILDYKTHIYCSNLMLIESVPGEPLSFHVIPFDNPRSQYTLQCRNLEQKREWSWQIKRVILENYNAVIPTHARQLVMELGQNKSEDDVQTNKILPKRHHLAPEYLEKRKHERGKTDAAYKSKILRSKKLETGQKMEDQFDKPASTEEQSQLDSRTEEETETTQLSNDKYTTKSDSTEKLEIKTLEQIVTQILKQNREFDKILKRQKHIISRNRDTSTKRKKKRETNSRSGKTVHDTLKNMKFLKNASQETSTEKECCFDSDCSKLLENSSPDSSFSHTEKENDFQDNSLDDSIPTSPSVWLRQQIQHLPVAPKKAGSLPRSFQITSDSSHSDSHFFRDFKVSLERPFTIASDKITSTMLFEGMERFYRGQFRRSNSNTTDDGSLTDGLRTPGESIDHINIHPEYKIYRSDLSTSILKNVLSSVQSKLSHIKLDASHRSESEKKALTRERRASRVIYLLAKHYHKTLRIKQKTKGCESGQCNQLTLSSASLPVYKQGSESLGARLANFHESENRISHVQCSKKAAAFLGVCTNSVLSIQPSSVSAAAIETIPAQQKNDSSFYEEKLSRLELQDDDKTNESTSQTPPPVLPKPRKELILEKMAERLKEEIALKSIEPHDSSAIEECQSQNGETGEETQEL